MDRELRKQQNLLVQAGTGVVLFAIWSVAKVNLYLGLSVFPMVELRQIAEEFGIDEKFFLIFMAAVVVIILLCQLGIRLYIGLSAASEGKGKNKSWVYLALTAVLLVTSIRVSWQNFGVDRVLAGERVSVDLITGICMEAASVYVLLELLISGIRVKMLRRKTKE